MTGETLVLRLGYVRLGLVRLGLDRLGLVRLNANSTFRHRHILSQILCLKARKP